MLQLIRENNFEELQNALEKSNTFQIHKFLLDIMNNKDVEIDGESFDGRKYQEEYLEGFEIYTALQNSNFSRNKLKKYSHVLVELAFKMCGFIKVMANTAMSKGIFLSDLESLYKVKPEIRGKLQEFIEILKTNDNEKKAIANISAAKAQVSNSIGNLLEKHEIGEDMLQFAQSYENVGQKEMAVKIYQGILNDFECNSVKLSSGLFPEVSHVDDRPLTEIKIYETAKRNLERLTEQVISEPKRVYTYDNITSQTTDEKGFLNKLRNLFKKN